MTGKTDLLKKYIRLYLWIVCNHKRKLRGQRNGSIYHLGLWVRNFEYVAQLFDYGSAIRKVMYTTNAVESIHSSLRKVTIQDAFPNENALLKLLYLRITELHSK